MFKKTLLATAATLALCAASAFAADTVDPVRYSKEIAQIKQQCAADWADSFQMRVFCEDQEMKALAALIKRGSISQ